MILTCCLICFNPRDAEQTILMKVRDCTPFPTLILNQPSPVAHSDYPPFPLTAVGQFRSG